jgi:hypothetical protein
MRLEKPIDRDCRPAETKFGEDLTKWIADEAAGDRDRSRARENTRMTARLCAARGDGPVLTRLPACPNERCDDRRQPE